MKRSKKQEIIESLKKNFSEHNTAVIVDYRGLNVADLTELRNRLREQTCSFKIVKNKLGAIATEGTPFSACKDTFQGPTAIAFSQDNPVSLAKILTEYAKINTNLHLKSGFLNGKILTPEEVKEVAKLPPKEVILGRLLGTIQAPISNLLSIIQGPARSLTCVLKAVGDQKEEKEN
ncbi:MAG: 50S ribosomal protein L10 [Candidatus Schekmanbacteria bacterium RBG_13_48_7]|uniref:Large ribosomal subunit protein uL10 n=1 Tax=Candidatus Schekmanbacteria bacterium RBG_13_48_7 TaxID=1817878 RepID=A0A1F7RJ66_9BACT|nr:MAG: 50S ribosomal protein L10 [Candidatus Schekmanbacteria bacterium RBG_13_48_7]